MTIKNSLITKAIILSIAGGLILSLALLWGVGFTDVLSTFLNAKWYLILGYILVSILIAVGVTYKWQVALDAYEVKLPFYSLFIYRLIGFAVGYVTPMSHVGGEPVRAMLVGKEGIPYKVSFSAVIVDKMLEILFNIGIFFLGALIIVNSSSFPVAARATIFILSIILVILAWMFTYHLFKKKKIFVPVLRFFRFHKRKNWEKVKRNVNEMEALIEYFYAKKRSHFVRALIVNAILWALMFIEYKLALLILGYNASLFGVFLFLTGVGLAYSIPIPAALGVLELGQISASALLGIKASTGVALAFLIRGRDILWTIIGLLFLGVYRLNIFKLYERSQRAAKRYSFEKLHPHLRSFYETIGEELKK